MLRTLTILGLALAGVTAMASNFPVASLAGEWAGDRMLMTFNSEGARIEMDCASGSINGPIKLGRNGSFAGRGHFERYHGGPQRADEAVNPSDARYTGTITGDLMKLSIVDKSSRTPHTYTLRKGARMKLIRCL